MNVKTDETVVTERGQTSIPAHLRKELRLARGQKLRWEKVSEEEVRVRVLRKPKRRPDPRAMLGFAKRFRDTMTTDQWMRLLREGEK